MNLTELTDKEGPKRVLGVDGSTKSLAFCLMEHDDGDWTPIQWGKMYIDGDDVYERCGDINRKLYGIMKHLHPDVVAFEAVVYINNRAVTIQLSKIIGAAIGVAHATGRDVSEIPPVTWMNYIGNPTRDSKEVKEAVKKEFPDKSKNWRKNELRRMRKQRTMDWVKDKFDVTIDDDDIADAFGVAWYYTQEQA